MSETRERARGVAGSGSGVGGGDGGGGSADGTRDVGETIYSYVNCDATEAFAGEVAIEGNTRVVARRAVARGALLYRGAPIMHVRGSEMGAIPTFLRLLSDADLGRLTSATRRTFPVTLRQTVEQIRKTTLCTEEQARQQAGDVFTRLALKFVLNSRDAQVAPLTFAAEIEAEEERETRERGPLGVFVRVSDQERRDKEMRRAAQRRARNWYVEASKFNHSCYPNCVWTLADNGEPDEGDHMQIIAVRDIAPGEECTIPYWFFRGRAFMGDSRQRRRDYVRETGGFECRCWLCEQGDDARKTPRDYLADLANIGVQVRIDLARFCRNCGVECADEADVKKCRACMEVGYCGAECQREHWTARHKKACTRRFRKRAAYAPATVVYVSSRQRLAVVQCSHLLAELRASESGGDAAEQTARGGSEDTASLCGLATEFKGSHIRSEYFSHAPVASCHPAFSFSPPAASPSPSASSSSLPSSPFSFSCPSTHATWPIQKPFVFPPPAPSSSPPPPPLPPASLQPPLFSHIVSAPPSAGGGQDSDAKRKCAERGPGHGLPPNPNQQTSEPPEVRPLAGADISQPVPPWSVSASRHYVVPMVSLATLPAPPPPPPPAPPSPLSLSASSSLARPPSLPPYPSFLPFEVPAFLSQTAPSLANPFSPHM